MCGDPQYLANEFRLQWALEVTTFWVSRESRPWQAEGELAPEWPKEIAPVAMKLIPFQGYDPSILVAVNQIASYSAVSHYILCVVQFLPKRTDFHWREGEYATPNYVTSVLWLFWIKGIWEKAGTKKGCSDPSSPPWKQEINLSCERYPLCTRTVEGIPITRDKEFRAEKAV